MKATPFGDLTNSWFVNRFRKPTEAQRLGWPHIVDGRDTLIAAPTGSGKTLAAFLSAIDRLLQLSIEGNLEDRTYVVYISPLKALGNDIRTNLQIPLDEIKALAKASQPDLRIAVRTGDTSQSERRKMIKQPPHILITTPESLYILLTAKSSRKFLSTADTIIVDEIHAIAGDKRGSHLSLSLQRLDHLTGARLQRIGLSATQKPIEEIASLLVGVREENEPKPAIVDLGHKRPLELSVEVTDQEMGPITTHELWAEIYDRIAAHTKMHRATLVYVNTRRLAERASFQLAERLGKENVAAHHGSLSKHLRLKAEQGLKSGEISVVVATASLELGIDIGHVDLVCHIGAPRSLASLIQRVGRSAHRPLEGESIRPKGIIFPLTRDELIQSAAAVRAVREGGLDRVLLPMAPLDILAQQIVAIVAAEEISEDDLYHLVRRAHPYRDLSLEDFNEVLEMASEGVATRVGRRSAHLHRDRINGILRSRRGARLTAITGGGAIPDTADYNVVLEPDGKLVGSVNEDFAIESLAGDIFLLGNKSWRIRRVAAGRVHVEDAGGAPPSIPFWLGEAPARTSELSLAVSEMRQDVAKRLSDIAKTSEWLKNTCGVDQAGAEQIIAYISETIAALGEVPSQNVVIAERFFDEAGGMQLVIHSPFGGRINRAWGLALRKRFCVTFDFELQAAATDDGIILSLGESHSFPIEDAFAFVRASTAEDALTQATLAAPMFVNRWRWNASRSLALRRFSGGSRVPMPIMRMRAEDLLSAVFPEQVMCQDNRSGPVEIPDHILVRQTIDDCLHEAMDIEGLQTILEAIESGKIRTLAIDTVAPSPISHEIINANPYAFLDDAPLEERRARAVSLRRVDPDLARGIGALDETAIRQVQEQAWPDVRDQHELHDALLSLVLLPVGEAEQWTTFFEQLETTGRGTRGRWRNIKGELQTAFVATERVALVQAAIATIQFDPIVSLPPLSAREEQWIEAGYAPREIIRGWMAHLGPTTAQRLASRIGLAIADVNVGLAQLEAEGILLRGHYNVNAEALEWCDRRLLARIHRMTINRLRREIQSVSASDFLRFLFRWQHVHPGYQLRGREGVRSVIAQLQGLELPARAWESSVIPARVEHYNPNDLETLCLGGEVVWGRFSPSKAARNANGGASGSSNEKGSKARQAPNRSARLGFVLREDMDKIFVSKDEPQGLTKIAQSVLDYLGTQGASFTNEIIQGMRFLPYQIEEALWELVANGLVTGDGLAGLRSLILPNKRRDRYRRMRRGLPPLLPSGRWALLRKPSSTENLENDELTEWAARQLLQRYGIVFRELLARERGLPPWREMLWVFRRLEARGEIRGGRFVDGFIGEQFALAEAVDRLRKVRRDKESESKINLAVADPLNLVGILTPGKRISPLSNQVVTFERGIPAQPTQIEATSTFKQ